MLRCNYDPRYLDPKLPIFHRDILSFFVQIKRQLQQKDEQDIILFNNKVNFNIWKTFLYKGMVWKRNYFNKGSPIGEWTISYL